MYLPDNDKEYYTESKLDIFLSQRKTHSDDGELMDFVVIKYKGINVCLKYKGGYMNRRTINNITYIDKLQSVEFGNGENVWTEIKYENISLNADLNYYYVIYTDTLGFKEGISKSSEIKFTYLIGAQIDSNEEIVKDSGVKYEEIRKM